MPRTSSTGLLNWLQGNHSRCTALKTSCIFQLNPNSDSFYNNKLLTLQFLYFITLTKWSPFTSLFGMNFHFEYYCQFQTRTGSLQKTTHTESWQSVLCFVVRQSSVLMKWKGNRKQTKRTPKFGDVLFNTRVEVTLPKNFLWHYNNGTKEKLPVKWNY